MMVSESEDLALFGESLGFLGFLPCIHVIKFMLVSSYESVSCQLNS